MVAWSDKPFSGYVHVTEWAKEIQSALEKALSELDIQQLVKLLELRVHDVAAPTGKISSLADKTDETSPSEEPLLVLRGSVPTELQEELQDLGNAAMVVQPLAGHLSLTSPLSPLEEPLLVLRGSVPTELQGVENSQRGAARL